MNRMHARGRIAVTAAALIAATATAGLAQSVNVTLNGSPIMLTPAPTERAGRVFVPLRGVFEKLGASVVYEGGVINAQGHGRSVSLKIGSTQATVDGQQQTLDVAPFIIGASTYVPLRFVSQALGASVNYDGANHIVALGTSDGQDRNSPPQAMAPPPQAPPRSALQVGRVLPGRGATVTSRRPEIEAQFTGAQADPNSVHVRLDGVDVTQQSSRSAAGFVFSPPSDLQSMEHTVQVSGKDANGAPFDRSWKFTSGTSAVSNEIMDLRPADGASVGQHFTVSGKTLPNARVVVQVGSVAARQDSAQRVIGQIFGANAKDGTSTVRNEVTADANGNFESRVAIDGRRGEDLHARGRLGRCQEPSGGASSGRATSSWNKVARGHRGE